MTDHRSLQGVAPATPPAATAVADPRVPYAMLNNHGDLFYPATVEEADFYARVHGAWALPPSKDSP